MARGKQRWAEIDELDMTAENGERVYANVMVEWWPRPILLMGEAHVWYIIATEEMFDDEIISWPEEMFAQTSLCVANGWLWVDRAQGRVRQYWETL